MKKILAVLFGAIAIAACSSSDDNSSSVDPIFSQPYTELSDLDELTSGKWAYVGNKIGDRHVGLIGETSNCKREDYLLVHRAAANGVLDSITYNNYRLDKVDEKLKCISIFDFPRLMEFNKIDRPGYMKTSIKDGYLHIIEKEGGKVEKEYRRKNHYDGELEIGFQAGFLRIEDHLSDYRYLKDEKVYLYFKKI